MMRRTRIYRYPDNWNEIARSIKEREGWKCAHCGVEHDSYILRLDRNDQSKWDYATESDFVDRAQNAPKLIHVILSVHHKGVPKPDGSPGDPHDKFDCRPENLVALCSRCHLIADSETHVSHARVTRARNKGRSQLEAGQGGLF